MKEYLKHCPFCGGEAEMLGDDDRMYQVFCPNCKATIVNFDDEKEVAAEKWNKRKIEGAQEDEIERLREALEEIKDAITLLNTEDVLEHISDRIRQALKGGEK